MEDQICEKFICDFMNEDHDCTFDSEDCYSNGTDCRHLENITCENCNIKCEE